VLDTDLQWGGADGVLTCLRARGERPVPVVLLTPRAAPSPESRMRVEAPVVAVIEKPIEVEALVCAVLSAADPGPFTAGGGGSAPR
jgi:CheY-like chemotaxis protein